MGNPCDWGRYLFEAFEDRRLSKASLKRALEKVGVEVVRFRDWPGFSNADSDECSSYTGKILERRRNSELGLDYVDLFMDMNQ